MTSDWRWLLVGNSEARLTKAAERKIFERLYREKKSVESVAADIGVSTWKASRQKECAAGTRLHWSLVIWTKGRFLKRGPGAMIIQFQDKPIEWWYLETIYFLAFIQFGMIVWWEYVGGVSKSEVKEGRAILNPAIDFLASKAVMIIYHFIERTALMKLEKFLALEPPGWSPICAKLYVPFL